mgnify:FL=1|nr:MAG TPA: hypothetical protein [Caudoviricetes sp.]
MSLAEFFVGGSGIAVAALTLVQVVPVKINPWSCIARFIGKALNKDMMDKLESVQDDVKDLGNKHSNLEYRMDKDKADDCRTRILRFGDELRRGVEHSEEFFNQILDDISDYKHYCTEHPEYKNDKAVNAIAEIEKVYQRCMEKNSFL